MTSDQARHVRIRNLLKLSRHGVGIDELRDAFCGEPKESLDLLILAEIRSGRVWVHKGRFFSKRQYQRATQD